MNILHAKARSSLPRHATRLRAVKSNAHSASKRLNLNSLGSLAEDQKVKKHNAFYSRPQIMPESVSHLELKLNDAADGLRINHVMTTTTSPQPNNSSILSFPARAMHTASATSEEELILQSKQEKVFTSMDYEPKRVLHNIKEATSWKKNIKDWNPQFCREAVQDYISHLKYLCNLREKSKLGETSQLEEDILKDASITVLSSNLTSDAMNAMLKRKVKTHHLSKEVRLVEKLIGTIGLTPLTNRLSFNLLRANGKAGNIGRVMSLLNLRKAKHMKPNREEFEHAIQSIVSAGLYLRMNRNVFLNETEQPEIDNPTRWLDEILVNMNSRGFPLDTAMANKMLECYSSTGRTGKATHFFYRVTREYIGGNTSYERDESIDTIRNGRNKVEEVDVLCEEHLNSIDEQMPLIQNRKARVRMKMVHSMPPYYKMPSENKVSSSKVRMPNKNDLKPKLEWEMDRDFSMSLTSAFAFADSLTHGACGHKAIELDRVSWNVLVRACVYRGAMMRALEILNDKMPNNGIDPDKVTYNTILSGLARVGDKELMREILLIMTNKSIAKDKYTVQALVDGYLNVGDISGAVTLVQDFFNQHHILPPYTTHLKIIEFALGNDLVYEAKRQVYFIQQLHKWRPKHGDSPSLLNFMNMTQKNPKLSPRSLKRLFAYFGEKLTEEDFF